ncbi:hypothetical protein ACFQXA_34305 [Nocardiopsis composta]
MEVFLLIGGAYGAGVATMRLVPALVCVLAAKRLPRMGRVGYALLPAFLAFVALWQVNRFTGGEPFGIAGFAFIAVLVVLLTVPSTRRHLRSPAIRVRAPSSGEAGRGRAPFPVTWNSGFLDVRGGGSLVCSTAVAARAVRCEGVKRRKAGRSGRPVLNSGQRTGSGYRPRADFFGIGADSTRWPNAVGSTPNSSDADSRARAGTPRS